jgi:hypothetical protein
VKHARVVGLVTTCVPGWFAAQSCRMTISDYSAPLVARAGVRNAPCVGAHERAISDCVGSPHTVMLKTVCKLLWVKCLTTVVSSKHRIN